MWKIAKQIVQKKTAKTDFIEQKGLHNIRTISHRMEPPFPPDVAPFTPIWGQEAPSPMVHYPELMAGFPCADLGKLLRVTIWLQP